MKKQGGPFLLRETKKEIPIRDCDFNYSLRFLQVFPTPKRNFCIILALLRTRCFCCKDKQHMLFFDELPIIDIYAVFH